MDVAALIISIAAIIISVIVAAVQIAKNKKINDINLEAELSKEIVKVYLTEVFPKAVSDVSFKKKRLTNIAPLQNALNGLRVKLKFYIYCDNEFYQNLKRPSSFYFTPCVPSSYSALHQRKELLQVR